MHIVYNTPHGILMILAFIFAIGALIRWPPPAPGSRNTLHTIAWFAWSWLFFVAAFIFAL